MTREEAIAIIRKEYLCVDRDCDIEKSCGRCDLMMPRKEPILEAFKMAMQALEQEPCEDAISRQAAIDAANKVIERDTSGNNDVVNAMIAWSAYIKSLPSVKPQEPKTIIYSGDGYADGYMVYDMAECPSCGYEYEDGDKDWGLSFCPNCGQKLDWEREDKE